MDNIKFDRKFGYKTIIGIDEVGRGPLAGPVFASAVMIDYSNFTEENILEGLTDSKKISKQKRDFFCKEIKEKYSYGIGFCEVEEIEKINIYNATKLAMIRSYDNLISKIGIIKDDFLVIIDGNMKFDNENFISVIKGDQKSYAISAASIIAKTTRDNLMQKLSLQYPMYDWDKNSGYGTKFHIESIKKNGITDYHRKSFLKKYI